MVEAQFVDLIQCFLRCCGEVYIACAVDFFTYFVYFFNDCQFIFIQEFEVAFFCFQCFQNFFSQRFAAFAAFCPYSCYCKCSAHCFASFFYICNFCICISYEVVQSYNNGNTIFLDVFDVFFQVYETFCQSIQVFVGQVSFCNAAIVFHCTYCRNQNNRIGFQACFTAFDIKEFFSTQVSTEACFCYNIVSNFHSCFCCFYRVAAVRDVCEGAAVDDCQCVFQSLNHVRLQSVFQQNCHCAVSADHFCCYGFVVICVTNDDLTQHFFQLFQVVCQTEDRHDFGCYCDLESIFSGYAVYFAAQTGDYCSQLSVVQVNAAFPGDSSGVDVQFVTLLDVVIYHGSQQIVCCCDSMQVTCEVQVDVFHRNYLSIAAASCAAFYAHAGTQGGFTQTCDRIFAHFLQCLCQTDCYCCFAFTCGCGVNSCNQNQFCIFVVFDFIEVFVADFAFVFAVAINVFFGNTCFFCYFQDVFHFTFLRNL